MTDPFLKCGPDALPGSSNTPKSGPGFYANALSPEDAAALAAIDPDDLSQEIATVRFFLRCLLQITFGGGLGTFLELAPAIKDASAALASLQRTQHMLRKRLDARPETEAEAAAGLQQARSDARRAARGAG